MSLGREVVGGQDEWASSKMTPTTRKFQSPYSAPSTTPTSDTSPSHQPRAKNNPEGDLRFMKKF